MPPGTLPTGVGPSPIQSILLAFPHEGPPVGESFSASSLPGHLLHYVLHGRVKQRCNGRLYELGPGSVLWYHEDELVEGAATEAPWQFYSVNFIAPQLPPPPYESRLFIDPHPPETSPLLASFAALVEAWSDESLEPNHRLFRCHVHLLEILDALAVPAASRVELHAPAQLWWDLEVRIRSDLSRPVGLRQLEQWSGCSAATISRSAQAATGLSPMRRVKQIRLSFARGLVQLSSLSLREIAEQVGYPRVHEFSRDYRRAFGMPPSRDRAELEGFSAEG